jgi:hypothetical protein
MISIRFTLQLYAEEETKEIDKSRPKRPLNIKKYEEKGRN